MGFLFIVICWVTIVPIMFVDEMIFISIFNLRNDIILGAECQKENHYIRSQTFGFRSGITIILLVPSLWCFYRTQNKTQTRRDPKQWAKPRLPNKMHKVGSRVIFSHCLCHNQNQPGVYIYKQNQQSKIQTRWLLEKKKNTN